MSTVDALITVWLKIRTPLVTGVPMLLIVAVYKAAETPAELQVVVYEAIIVS